MTLIIFLLSIKSSYLDNTEFPATTNQRDTIQFCITPENAWRVKTFAVDEDVHVHLLGKSTQNISDVVTESTERTYGDVIVRKLVVKSTDGLAGIRREIDGLGLHGELKESKNGFFFWVPAHTHYQTKSEPRS